MKQLKYATLLGVILFVFSCKSVRTIREGSKNLSLSTKQLIKENTKQAANFKALQSKLKITYATGNKSQSHTVNFRLKKDEVIWMNASFSVVRAKITPEKVSFYNKLDNTYFDGDFSYLSHLLGTDIDFKALQNLLLGETLYSLNKGQYTASVNQDAYWVRPKQQLDVFKILYIINPKIFKVQSQQITQNQEQRYLQIDYVSYQEVSKQKLPERINILAQETNEQIHITLEFKNTTLDEDLRFPFKIPSGFKAIEL
ncbi:MAG: DUF4292 domain-containing protein [Aestuariibaculum sp.]